MSSPSAIEFGLLMRRLTDDPALDAGMRGALEHLGRRLWDALREGHACLRVASLHASLPDGMAAGELDAALAHAVDNAPWLLDIEHDRVWLRRMARLEQTVADALRAVDVADPLVAEGAVAAWIDTQFGVASASSGSRDASQRQAVRTALARRLLVLTGGPGTGKTATLARIVQAARALAGDVTIRVAAPTGKAAARLGEQLRARGIDRIDPSTVHALLEIDRSGRARHNRSDPIAADLVLIDECSMLDLRLCTRLLEALPPRARLVLAGDRDQLASVDPGAVFAELTEPGVLPDALVTLSHNFRQQDAARLAAFAEAARMQRLEDAHAALAGASDELQLRPPAERAAAFVDEAIDGYRPLLDALRRGAEPAELLATLGAYRFLTALRDGPLGSVALNRAIAGALAARAGAYGRSPAWRGRVLMVIANDREQRLWNGDVGISTGDGSVLFADGSAAGGARRVPYAALPAHEDAFAMTVHKAQGSEFEAVSMLPAPLGHALAVRELLYTGVTRARRRCIVHAHPDAIAAALRTPTRREGALGQRLRQR